LISAFARPTILAVRRRFELKAALYIALTVVAAGVQQAIKKDLALKGRVVTIQTEIDDVLGSGHYSALPAPDAAPTSTRHAVVRVVNNSRNTVRFLETGPTSELHPIPSGGNREMVVSPGDYQIVAKLEGSGALALYRKQTYSPATKYIFLFR